MEKHHGYETGGGGAAGVFYARPSSPEPRTRFPDGFTGTLALQNPVRLNGDAVSSVLQRLHTPDAWRYAQQDRTLLRLRVTDHGPPDRAEPPPHETPPPF